MTEDYFVRIDDSKHIERGRLQLARRVLLCSAAYLMLKDIRERKSQFTLHLKEQMESVAALFHQLETLLPHKELLTEDHSPKPLAVVKKAMPSPVSASSHKMDKLQEALTLIEKKIESLDL